MGNNNNTAPSDRREQQLFVAIGMRGEYLPLSVVSVLLILQLTSATVSEIRNSTFRINCLALINASLYDIRPLAAHRDYEIDVGSNKRLYVNFCKTTSMNCKGKYDYGVIFSNDYESCTSLTGSQRSSATFNISLETGVPYAGKSVQALVLNYPSGENNYLLSDKYSLRVKLVCDRAQKTLALVSSTEDQGSYQLIFASADACPRINLTSFHEAFIEKNLILVGVQLATGIIFGFFGFKICKALTFAVVTLGVTTYFQILVQQYLIFDDTPVIHMVILFLPPLAAGLIAGYITCKLSGVVIFGIAWISVIVLAAQLRTNIHQEIGTIIVIIAMLFCGPCAGILAANFILGTIVFVTAFVGALLIVDCVSVFVARYLLIDGQSFLDQLISLLFGQSTANKSIATYSLLFVLMAMLLTWWQNRRRKIESMAGDRRRDSLEAPLRGQLLHCAITVYIHIYVHDKSAPSFTYACQYII
eukprot:TRINITY_DN4043_c0_g1_i3.p1 TRINITY_DN4043_c0_g1~~TRINITY_DN4043_c0_g1_i3.p1  ORF type:complete len:474 (-),score=70.49 TRINITY_DN4043_c0_g1_i3:146-1567(-)